VNEILRRSTPQNGKGQVSFIPREETNDQGKRISKRLFEDRAHTWVRPYTAHACVGAGPCVGPNLLLPLTYHCERSESISSYLSETATSPCRAPHNDKNGKATSDTQLFQRFRDGEIIKLEGRFMLGKDL